MCSKGVITNDLLITLSLVIDEAGRWLIVTNTTLVSITDITDRWFDVIFTGTHHLWSSASCLAAFDNGIQS